MEPRDRPAQAVSGRTPRRHVVAWSAVLVALAFAQAPGRTVADTKLDLVVDPWRFLGRALTLWDGQGTFGQLQNQAYGYLFPMGPFFGLLHSAHVPPWVAQRLWWGLVLVVAFAGVVLLLDALRVGAPWARVLAGVAFALSPRMLSVIGPSSIEVWPSALAPWVLLPLVLATRRGDPRRWAALSAVAVFAVGGVNAVATFAVIPLAALWIVLAPPGPRRRALLLWWPPCVLAAVLWWLLPLVLLGRYSPEFLDYIEGIANTSFAATPFDALRGTTNWVPYLSGDADAGRLVLTDSVVVLNGVVLVAFGLLGLAWVDARLRRFLVLGLLGGFVLVTLGHQGALSGWGSGTLRDLLDGSLSPLRNAHKFDPVLRLPLVIGLCAGVSELTRRVTASQLAGTRLQRVGVTLVAVAAVAGATSPAWTGHLAPRNSFDALPSYWGQTATWLDGHANGRTLLAPASRFGDYAWGHTNDEPMQALSRTDWAVRNVIPLTPATTITWLDTLERAWSSGQGSQALADSLRRAGVGTIVLRHDLDRAQQVTSPELVRSTLLSTPGVRRVKTFGPVVGGGPTLRADDGRRVFVDGGLQGRRPAVEVFELGPSVDESRTVRADHVDRVAGDTDSLLRLADLGLSEGREAVLGPDAAGTPARGRVVLTDGNRRQEAAFGEVRDNRSVSLAAQERYRLDRRVHRYDQSRLGPWTTTPQLVGARSLTASSSAGYADATAPLRQDSGPWAAFDGDAGTAWRPESSEAGRRSWLRLSFGRATDLGSVTIRAQQPAARTTTVRVSTSHGPRSVDLVGTRPAKVSVGSVRTLQISGRTSAAAALAIGEVTMEHEVSRPLVLPRVPRAWGTPDTVLLQSQRGAAGACAVVDDATRCPPQTQLRSEDDRLIDRVVSLASGGRYAANLRARPIGGAALTSLVQRDRLVSITASSQATDSPRATALAAVDGEATTGWTADPNDPDPTLTVSWVGRRSIDRVRVRTGDLAATPVRSLTIVAADGERRIATVKNGVARFRPLLTTNLTLHLRAGRTVGSAGFDGSVASLPVGVSELRVAGAPQQEYVPSTRSTRWPCGSGPNVVVEGRTTRTALVGSAADLLSGRPTRTRWCGSDTVRLRAGENRVTVGATAVAAGEDLVLRSAPDEAEGPAPDLVVRTHNANTGWQATTSGGAASATTANGWQQAWWVRPGTGDSLRAQFGPGGTYRLALMFGALGALALLLFAGLRRPIVHEAVTDPEPVPPPSSRVSSALVAAGGAVVAVLTAGAAGVVAVAVGALAAILIGRRRPSASVWVAPTLWVVAGLIAFARPWGGTATWEGDLALPQVLVLVSLGALVGCVVPRRPGQRAFLSFKKGRSTPR